MVQELAPAPIMIGAGSWGKRLFVTKRKGNIHWNQRSESHICITSGAETATNVPYDSRNNPGRRTIRPATNTRKPPPSPPPPIASLLLLLQHCHESRNTSCLQLEGFAGSRSQRPRLPDRSSTRETGAQAPPRGSSSRRGEGGQQQSSIWCRK